MRSERELVPSHETKDIILPFALLKDLFEYAREIGLNETSFEAYANHELPENPAIAVLPKKFESLVADFPGKFYLVSFDDRSSSYYRAGTRSVTARLSTVKKKNISNQAIQEIDLEQVDPTDGNVLRITQTSSINNKSFVDLNSAPEDEVEQPHGQARNIFEVDAMGYKNFKSSQYDRLDEGFFDWHGQRRPVRWVRNAEASLSDDGAKQLFYKELFIIGREMPDERAEVRVTISGDLENPQSILVEIGYGPLQTARVIINENNLKVVEHEPINAYKNQIEIIRNDPNYAFLFEKSADPNQLVKIVQAKVRSLQTDWDKPANIFTEDKSLTHQKSIE